MTATRWVTWWGKWPRSSGFGETNRRLLARRERLLSAGTCKIVADAAHSAVARFVRKPSEVRERAQRPAKAAIRWTEPERRELGSLLSCLWGRAAAGEKRKTAEPPTATIALRNTDEHRIEMDVAQIIVAFVFGVVFVALTIVLAIKYPHPTLYQYNVFRTVLALAAAGIAAMIPGLITIEFVPTTELLIRALGGLAVFVIVFFFNPATILVQSPKGEGANAQNSPVGAMSSRAALISLVEQRATAVLGL